MIEHVDETWSSDVYDTAGRRVSRQASAPTDGCADGTAMQSAPLGAIGRKALETGKVLVSALNGSTQIRNSSSTPAIKVQASRKLLRSRRGESPQEISYEILSPMSPARSAGGGDSEAPPISPDSVSAFIARVLDQLALGSWLPAAFLTVSIALILQFRSTGSANLLSAVKELTANPLQVLVIIVPLLVIATFITQAFSFEAIRALEGYWRGSGLVGIARTLMIRRHVHRRNAIRRRRLDESRKAFNSAMPGMIHGNVPTPVLQAIEAHLSERGDEARTLMRALSTEEIQLFTDTFRNWRSWCDAWHLAKIDHLINEEKCYPATYRILPTKLGNMIRATEDDLKHTGGDVRRFVLRKRDLVSSRIQLQHDQFRSRLEMYCTMVFVCVFLAILSLFALTEKIGILSLAIITIGFVVTGVASYLAAIASAEGYCTVLKQIDEASEPLDAG